MHQKYERSSDSAPYKESEPLFRPTIKEHRKTHDFVHKTGGAHFCDTFDPHRMGYIGLAATGWVPMGAEIAKLSPNDQTNPSYGQHKGFGKNRILLH